MLVEQRIAIGQNTHSRNRFNLLALGVQQEVSVNGLGELDRPLKGADSTGGLIDHRIAVLINQIEAVSHSSLIPRQSGGSHRKLASIAQMVGIIQLCVSIGVIITAGTSAFHRTGQIDRVGKNQFVLRNIADLPVEALRIQRNLIGIRIAIVVDHNSFRSGVVEECLGADNTFCQNIRTAAELAGVCCRAIVVEGYDFLNGGVYRSALTDHAFANHNAVYCFTNHIAVVQRIALYGNRRGIEVKLLRCAVRLCNSLLIVSDQIELLAHLVGEGSVTGSTDGIGNSIERICELCGVRAVRVTSLSVFIIRSNTTEHSMGCSFSNALVISHTHTNGIDGSAQTADIFYFVGGIQIRVDDLVLLAGITLDGLCQPHNGAALVFVPFSLTGIIPIRLAIIAVFVKETLGASICRHCSNRSALQEVTPANHPWRTHDVVDLQGHTVGHEDHDLLTGFAVQGIPLLLCLQQIVGIFHTAVIVSTLAHGQLVNNIRNIRVGEARCIGKVQGDGGRIHTIIINLSGIVFAGNILIPFARFRIVQHDIRVDGGIAVEGRHCHIDIRLIAVDGLTQLLQRVGHGLLQQILAGFVRGNSATASTTFSLVNIVNTSGHRAGGIQNKHHVHAGLAGDTGDGQINHGSAGIQIVKLGGIQLLVDLDSAFIGELGIVIRHRGCDYQSVIIRNRLTLIGNRQTFIGAVRRSIHSGIRTGSCALGEHGNSHRHLHQLNRTVVLKGFHQNVVAGGGRCVAALSHSAGGIVQPAGDGVDIIRQLIDPCAAGQRRTGVGCFHAEQLILILVAIVAFNIVVQAKFGIGIVYALGGRIFPLFLRTGRTTPVQNKVVIIIKPHSAVLKLVNQEAVAALPTVNGGEVLISIGVLRRLDDRRCPDQAESSLISLRIGGCIDIPRIFIFS